MLRIHSDSKAIFAEKWPKKKNYCAPQNNFSYTKYITFNTLYQCIAFYATKKLFFALAQYWLFPHIGEAF